jgi:hypothetical protein
MRVRTLHREQWIPASLAEVFAFFSHAGNLDRITPPWLHFNILGQTDPELKVGTLIFYKLAWHGFPLAWTSRIEEWRPPTLFVDVQVKGPYRLWHRAHTFEARDGGTLIRDMVRYAIQMEPLGDSCAGMLVRRDVERIFTAERAA